VGARGAGAVSDRRPLAGPPLTATYRLQLHAGFTFDDARRLVPYLQRLGVSHLYLSPVLAARPGSTHGYDVVDPTRANPALGGDAGFDALSEAAHAHGLGIVLDIVPNHMGAGPANPYWLDVLALGRESAYARWFDIDWTASHARGRLVLPVLGDDPEAVLSRGELKPALHEGRFVVRYFDHVFPLDPRTVHRLFAFTHTYVFPPHAREEAEAWAQARAALAPAGGASLSAAEATAAVRAAIAVVEGSAAVRAYLDWALDVFASGDDGRWRLQSLLDLQRWRLAHWQETVRELHFRRFFDVTELVAVRVEDPAVFDAYHAWLLDRVARGQVDGVRVDHVDGLRDPHAYLDMLRAALDARRPDARVPVFVEKILSHGERMRPEWPVDGTTGYEALNDLEAALVSAPGAAKVERAYRKLLRARPDAGFEQVAARGKEHVLRTTFRPELRRLVSLLMRVARALRVEATPAAFSEALLQLATTLPVYRTYVRESPDGGPLIADASDRALLEGALAAALGRGAARPEVLRFVTGVLLGDVPGDVPTARAARVAAHEAAMRFQQASGPATAKGIEDTAIYRWFPLASLNEVGGEPGRALDDAVARLHAANAERRAHWPRSLVTVTTHDTKRAADTRARLDALAELAGEWGTLVSRWHRRHAPLRARAGRRVAPDANTEYLLYQTLVGVWPEGQGDAPADDVLVGRVEEYLRKAMREAKAQSSWTAPNEPFESGTLAFARALLREEAGAPFRAELAALVARVAPAGRWNALARTTLQLAGAGVPDVYQGDEMWLLALVDPDNRRPVDWAERKVALVEREQAPDAGAGAAADVASLLRAAADGRLKLHLVRALLHARRRDPALFGEGAYHALDATGSAAGHLLAFARVQDGRAAIAVAPRLPLGLAPDGAPPLGALWGDTVLRLPPDVLSALGGVGRPLRDVVGGGVVAAAPELPLRGVLDRLPTALLVSGA
jgi:(1->4)-alpha-D-glucan 1-alpha-D-glucosylmutase